MYQITTKFDKDDQMHVEQLQEGHFLRVKKNQRHHYTGLGVGYPGSKMPGYGEFPVSRLAACFEFPVTT